MFVPRIVQLGGEPNLGSGHAGGLDALADLLLVAVAIGRVNVAVAGAECGLDGVLDLAGLGLPCAQADGGDLVARRQVEDAPCATNV